MDAVKALNAFLLLFFFLLFFPFSFSSSLLFFFFLPTVAMYLAASFVIKRWLHF